MQAIHLSRLPGNRSARPGVLADPNESYRRVDLEARIEGSDGLGLTWLCLERALEEIDQALAASRRRDRGRRNRALARAVSAVIALRQGVAQDNPLRAALEGFYEGIARGLHRAMASGDDELLPRLRGDLGDILQML